MITNLKYPFLISCLLSFRQGALCCPESNVGLFTSMYVANGHVFTHPNNSYVAFNNYKPSAVNNGIIPPEKSYTSGEFDVSSIKINHRSNVTKLYVYVWFTMKLKSGVVDTSNDNSRFSISRIQQIETIYSPDNVSVGDIYCTFAILPPHRSLDSPVQFETHHIDVNIKHDKYMMVVHEITIYDQEPVTMTRWFGPYKDQDKHWHFPAAMYPAIKSCDAQTRSSYLLQMPCVKRLVVDTGHRNAIQICKVSDRGDSTSPCDNIRVGPVCHNITEIRGEPTFNVEIITLPKIGRLEADEFYRSVLITTHTLREQSLVMAGWYLYLDVADGSVLREPDIWEVALHSNGDLISPSIYIYTDVRLQQNGSIHDASTGLDVSTGQHTHLLYNNLVLHTLLMGCFLLWH
jgi:hypothetical protein